MQINFIGTGGAFDIHVGNSAAILTLNDKKILIDCGNTTFANLMSSNLVDNLDYILITHLHDDHVGSLTTLIFYHYFFVKTHKIKLLVPQKFYDELFNYISFSLKDPNLFIEIELLEGFKGIKAIDTIGKHFFDMQTYAFDFEDESDRIVFSGDLNDPELILKYLNENPSNKKTIVFHDLSFNELAKSAHCFYKDLFPLSNNYELYGYHCNPIFNPEDNVIPLVFNNKQFMI